MSCREPKLPKLGAVAISNTLAKVVEPAFFVNLFVELTLIVLLGELSMVRSVKSQVYGTILYQNIIFSGGSTMSMACFVTKVAIISTSHSL